MRPSETVLSSIRSKICKSTHSSKPFQPLRWPSYWLPAAVKKDSAPAASAASSADNGAEKKEIVFGTTVGDFGDMVKDQIQPALEKKGYKVKLIEFTDYVRPNLALAEGELDINIFQHKPYLDDFKKEHKLDIVEAFQVPTAPLGLYPGKLKSLDEVKDGVSVSAPNDPSNFARALVMLNELGWIKLKADVDPLTASKKRYCRKSKKHPNRRA